MMWRWFWTCWDDAMFSVQNWLPSNFDLIVYWALVFTLLCDGRYLGWTIKLISKTYVAVRFPEDFCERLRDFLNSFFCPSCMNAILWWPDHKPVVTGGPFLGPHPIFVEEPYGAAVLIWDPADKTSPHLWWSLWLVKVGKKDQNPSVFSRKSTTQTNMISINWTQTKGLFNTGI